MSEVRRVLLANGQYIEIVQETGTSTGAVMSQNAVTTALNGKANSSHNHTASNITEGTFSSARIADGAVTSGKLATNAVTTAKVVDGAITRAKLASDVPISVTQYETVTVTGACSDGSSIAGKQLSIGGSLYEFDSNGVVSANIPYGQVYIVKPIMNNFYSSNDFYTFTASEASRSITVNYSLFYYNVYIEDKQGKLYQTADWSSGNNENANSVVLLSDVKRFRIALTSSSRVRMNDSASNSTYWNGKLSNTKNSGTTDLNIALADYNGEYNTSAILEKCQSATTYAAGLCNAYTFPDGTSKGYLPAEGELKLISINRNMINSALSACGGSQLVTSTYWSSTFYGLSNDYYLGWAFSMSSGQIIGPIDENHYVRPCAIY